MLPTRPHQKLSHILLALGVLAMVSPASATTYVYRTMISGGKPVAVCAPGFLMESTVNASLAFTVPAQGCSTITVTLNGAAGGNGANGGIGGSGGAITFQLPASTYTGNWTGVVGQGGFGQTTAYQGGAGGGYTSVSFNGVLLGAAGGGGGAGDGENGGNGGLTAAGGGNSPAGPTWPAEPTGGGGATDSGPGAGGVLISDYNTSCPSNPGSGMAGGAGECSSVASGGAGVGDGGVSPAGGTSGNGGPGGGGGGYFGGGGGTLGGDDQSGGGGGGGSDFAISSATGVTDTVGGGAPAGAGAGATGNNGSITISWQ